MSNPTTKRSFRISLNKLDLILIGLLIAASIWLYGRIEYGMTYNWRWEQAFNTLFYSSHEGATPYFIQGVIATLRLSLWGIIFSAILGLLLALARRSTNQLFTFPAQCYIQLVRNIPPLVFVFIFYFFISSQLIPAIGLSDLLRNNQSINGLQQFLFGERRLWENLISGVLCVGLISAAYIAEIIRSGIESIDKGQWEAADSLGLSTIDKQRFIILPQAFKATLPPLAGQFISLVKDSSIISLISIQELTFVGSEIANSSGLIFETWILVGLVYFVLCFSLSMLFRGLEKYNHKSER
ncbi:amino acid ABC transporter permease [Vibrio sp. SS-MA-C1-2]|uniref:amino acid ABC transporter permease n=1 Tax=Vibrio sp. SS-MA-C1-2 TaxID=2908646 RepID=UPI001F2A4F08|nr:amino acid ABC transporter permease [Vibrio sp. SS-MA-C1-2]UJF17578.1 amino acid ABC transporter permease [Vibrio sp. SS-MA-C1-2]